MTLSTTAVFVKSTGYKRSLMSTCTRRPDVRSGGQDGLKEFKKLAERPKTTRQRTAMAEMEKNFNGVNEVVKPKTLSSEEDVYLPPGIVSSSRLSQCKHSLKPTKHCMGVKTATAGTLHLATK